MKIESNPESEKILKNQCEGMIALLNRTVSRILILDEVGDKLIPSALEITEIIQDSLDAAKRALRNRQDFIFLEKSLQQSKAELSKEIESNIQLKRLIARNESKSVKPAVIKYFSPKKEFLRWFKNAPVKFSWLDFTEAFSNADKAQKKSLRMALYVYMEDLVKSGQYTKSITTTTDNGMIRNLTHYEKSQPKTTVVTEQAPETSNGESSNSNVQTGDPQQPGVEAATPQTN